MVKVPKWIAKAFLKDKPLIIITTCILAAFAINVVFLAVLLGKRQAARKEVYSKKEQLSGYRDRSDLDGSGITRLEKQRDGLKKEYDKYALRFLPELPRPEKNAGNSAGFKDLLFEKEEFLKNLAKSKGVKFSGSLGFQEFERKVLHEDEIPLLLRKLDMAEELAMNTILAGVDIENIEAADPVELKAGEETAFLSVPFRMNLTLSTKKLAGLLRGFSKARHQTMITKMDVLSGSGAKAEAGVSEETQLRINVSLSKILPKIKSPAAAYESLRKEALALQDVFDDREEAVLCESLLAEWQKGQGSDRDDNILRRDIFSEFTAGSIVEGDGPSALKLLSVDRAPLPLIYQGYIKLEDGTMIAQVNWDKKTYFAIQGEGIGRFKVSEITRDSLRMTGPSGKEIRLEHLIKTYEDEFSATLQDPTSNRHFTVKKGAALGEYKVLDIGEDSVLLLHKNNHIKLTLE